MIICIASLVVNKIYKKHTYCKTKNTATIKMHEDRLNPVPAPGDLCAICAALSLKLKHKKRANSILKYLSNQSYYHNAKSTQASQKYLERFTYKYCKQHTNEFRLAVNDSDKKQSKEYIVPIIMLYILYKVLAGNNKFSAYRKLNNGRHIKRSN